MFLPIQDDFTPDAPILEGGSNGAVGVTQIGPANVLNTGKGFAPFGTTTVITSTAGVGAAVLGRFSFRASNGTYYTFAGTATTIKAVSGTTWDDVSRTVGGAYATASGDVWNFASFGDRVIAVNYTDDTQTYLAGTDTDYSALAATAPKAKYVTVSGDFVVLGYVNDGTVYPFRVQWCAQGDPTAAWTPSATTQADYDDLDSNNGVVTGVVGFADYFYVFQERAITRYDYVGSPLVFRATEVSPGLGSIAPNSICRVGERVFFVTREGFKEISPGGIKHIGQGKLDVHWWAGIYSGSNEALSLSKMSAVGDPSFPIVHFATAVGSTTVQNTIYSYNYLFGKWTITTPDNTLNMLGVIYSTAFPWGTVAAFRSSDNKLYDLWFENQSATAIFYSQTLQTSENGDPVNINRIRLAYDAPDSPTITIVCLVNEPGGFPGYGLATGATLTNVTDSRDYVGRVLCDLIRFKISIASWVSTKKIYGVKILEMSKSGGR